MANTDLTRTTGTPTNVDKFTISVWVKRTKLGVNNCIIGNYADGNNRSEFSFRTTDKLRWECVDGGNNVFYFNTNRLFRDTNAWYHIVFAYDSSLGTSTDRFKLYINGVQETSFASTYYPAQNADSRLNTSGQTVRVGSRGDGNEAFEGCMSHFHFIDGTQYAASDFGSTDSTTGEWKINTSPSVTYGNNGFFILKDGNSLTDQSPNTNNFTLNGGTLTKTEDCPSNIFATWNPLDNKFFGGTYSNGNNTCSSGNNGNTFGTATIGVNKGKYYWECKQTYESSGGSTLIGITGKHGTSSNMELGNNTDQFAYLSSGNWRTNNSNTSNGVTYGNNDIIGVALNLTDNQISFYKNGTIVGSAQSITAISGTNTGFYFPSFGDWLDPGYVTVNANFGNGFFGTTAVSSNSGSGYSAAGSLGIFQYQPPTGYTALCTKGLNQ